MKNIIKMSYAYVFTQHVKHKTSYHTGVGSLPWAAGHDLHETLSTQECLLVCITVS